MVDIIIKNRHIEIPALNLVSYGIALVLFLILVSFLLPTQPSPPPIYSDQSVNRVFWIHITAIDFWLLCIIGSIPSTNAMYRNPKPQEVLPVIEDDRQLTLEAGFYVNRSDSMDMLMHHLRSGISILLGIVTAVILWLLSLTSPLDYVEDAFLLGSASLALLAVISLLLSFGDTSVRAYGTTLEEDLIPHTQKESQYIAQLREMLINKRKVTHQMKETIGVGLVLFIAVPAIRMLNPILSSIPAVPSEPLISALSFVSTGLMLFLIVMIGMIIVGNLGIRIVDDDESGDT